MKKRNILAVLMAIVTLTAAAQEIDKKLGEIFGE